MQHTTAHEVRLPHAHTEDWVRISALLSAPITSYTELEEVIKKIKLDLVPDVMAHFTLDGLKKVVEEAKLPFFEDILPFMCRLALRLTSLFESKTVPLLISKERTNDEGCTITLSREQVACLVANMFFCTFGESDFHLAFMLSGYREREYANSQANKVRCILHYFHKMVTSASFFEGDPIVYHRKTLLRHQKPNFHQTTKPLCRFTVKKEGKIDDATDCTMIDFANEFLGGGAVQLGCTQEEIIFVTHPECLPALLLVEDRMQDNDTIVMSGVRRLCKYLGYQATFRFQQNEDDEDNNIPREFIAMDAIPFVMGYEEQFQDEMLVREVMKAYCGFLDKGNTREIATGNWGCGAFCGDLQLKSLIQWIAASEADRPGLRYFVFEKQEHGQRLEELVELLEGATVGWLWEVVVVYAHSRQLGDTSDLFDVVKRRWASTKQ